MLEKIKCPKCGSPNIEPYKHGAVKSGEPPKETGKMTYECQKCGHEFDEKDLKE